MNVMPYNGPAIHDGSPTTDIIAALTAARTHSVPAVRDHLVNYLTGLLTSR